MLIIELKNLLRLQCEREGYLDNNFIFVVRKLSEVNVKVQFV